MPTIDVQDYNVQVKFPDDMPMEDIQAALEKQFPPLEAGQQPRENIYDADQDAVINAPMYAPVEQIRYEDAVTNLGKSKADYFGYKESAVPKEMDFYDKTMEFLSIPTEDVALKTSQIAASALRAINSTGLTDKQATDALLRKIEIGNAKMSQSLIEKNQKYESSFKGKLAKDVFVGVAQLPYYAAARTKRGAKILWGLLSSSKFEELYQESNKSEAAGAAISAGLASAVDAFGSHLFFGSVIDNIALSATKKVIGAAVVSATEEAAASLTEDISTISFGIREKSAKSIIRDAIYSGTVGMFIGTTAGGVSAYSGAKYKSKLSKELSDAGVQNHEDIADKIIEESIVAADDLTITIENDVAEINNDPKQVDEFYAAVKDIAEGNMDSIAAKMEDAGIPKAEISRVVDRLAAIKREGDEIKAINKDAEVIAGRVEKLDTDIKSIDKNIDELQRVIDERAAQDKPNAANTKRLESLLARRGKLDEERAELLSEAKKIEARKENLLPKPKQDIIQKLPEERRETYEAAAKGIDFKSKAVKKFLDTAIAAREGLENTLTPIDSRLMRISPSIGSRFRNFQASSDVRTADRINAADSLLRKMSKMPKRDFSALDIAMKNRWEDDINVIAKEHGLTADIKKFRKIMDNLYDEAKSVGIDLGYLQSYFPRVIKDSRKFLAHIRKSEYWTMFDEALGRLSEKTGRVLTEQEKSEAIRRMLMGRKVMGVDLAIPDSAKVRSVDEIDKDLMQFYAPTTEAIVHYITDVTESIEQRKFFGANKNSPDELENIISTFVLRELEAGNITPSQDSQIMEIFKARFNQERMNPWVRLYKNSQYILTMGNVKSAITQIGDVYMSLYMNGLYNTALGISDLAQGKVPVTRKDLNINTIAQEFSGDSISSKAVDLVFTANFLKTVDGFGKETFLSSSMRKLSDQARRDNASLKRKIDLIFEGEADSVMSDLANNNVTENVKMLLATELMRVQPITLSQMPLKYLQNPNGRVFYMLKTFTIKHLDIVRTEVFDNLRSDPKLASQNLVRLAFFYSIMGATADEIKSLLVNKAEDLSDIFIDNLLKFAGASKFQVDRAKRQSLGETIKDTVFPPTRSPKDWRDVPVIGDLYYYWFGHGKEKGK